MTRKTAFITIFTSVGITSIVPIVPLLTSNTAIGTTKLIAHRGYSAKYFQNTYAAFKGASDDKNFYGAETDLQMDKDRHIWCSHYSNPFKDHTIMIGDKTTDEIKTLNDSGQLFRDGPMQRPLDNKAYPVGEMNPYNVDLSLPDTDALCPFYDSSDGKDGKGYLNTFIGNNKHPIIELKIESLLNKETGVISTVELDTFINKVFVDIKTANDTYDDTLISRIYFISFFDDLLYAMVEHAHFELDNTFPISHFQKLFDDGAVGQYITSINPLWKHEIGNKKDSNSNVNRWEKYLDGSWYDGKKDKTHAISIDPYYALVNNSMIKKAHENHLNVDCWTADYSRTEVYEPMSLAMLANAGVDMITQDDWFNYS